MPDYVGPPIVITSGVVASIPDPPNMNQEGPPSIPSDLPYGAVRMKATIDMVDYRDPDRAVVHFQCLTNFYSAVRCTHERAKMMENLAALGLHVEYDRDLRMLLFGFPA